MGVRKKRLRCVSRLAALEEDYLLALARRAGAGELGDGGRWA